jgi:hypothetical protein
MSNNIPSKLIEEFNRQHKCFRKIRNEIQLLIYTIPLTLKSFNNHQLELIYLQRTEGIEQKLKCADYFDCCMIPDTVILKTSKLRYYQVLCPYKTLKKCHLQRISTHGI